MSDVIKFQRRTKPKPPRRRPTWLRRLLIIPGIAAALFVIWTYFYLTTPSQAGAFARCGVIKRDCVVDGDTLYVGGTKLRVADIDTPEISEPKCASEKALGERATERLIELVNAGPFEVSAWQGRDEDQYGRKLRVLIRDGRSLGDILVSEGLARTWSGRREPWC
ncbi:thermonuclease family protein [Sinorhizobium meliloti WSM1022]|uniref:thermonuclease family protein n=1 Tax=Rhizobium meliloti TaxID=382 RepID=UPI0003FC9469|nr:thermonuclease family protein [Sinorhizobium meliloti]QKN14306.1 thermonuclease family protein [Sinorhizobium meliloti WSM1022]